MGNYSLAGLLGLFLVASTGCVEALVVAAVAPQVFATDFDARRAIIKQEWADGRLALEAARESCIAGLTRVDSGHVAPPPYPERVCDFGSFWDDRYEWSKAVQVGLYTQLEWQRLCDSHPAKPAEADACRYDPLGERLTAWKAAVSTMQASPDGARMECELLFANRPQELRARYDGVCEFDGVAPDPINP